MYGSEKCDDGNQIDGDGCSKSCKIENGYQCPTPNKPCNANCGDSLIKGLETCDNGNKIAGDGKGAAGDGCCDLCLVEAEYTCATEGTLCTAAAEEKSTSKSNSLVLGLVIGLTLSILAIVIGAVIYVTKSSGSAAAAAPPPGFNAVTVSQTQTENCASPSPQTANHLSSPEIQHEAIDLQVAQ